jgi:hypothetical protein
MKNRISITELPKAFLPLFITVEDRSFNESDYSKSFDDLEKYSEPVRMNLNIQALKYLFEKYDKIDSPSGHSFTKDEWTKMWEDYSKYENDRNENMVHQIFYQIDYGTIWTSLSFEFFSDYLNQPEVYDRFMKFVIFAKDIRNWTIYTQICPTLIS